MEAVLRVVVVVFTVVVVVVIVVVVVVVAQKHCTILPHCIGVQICTSLKTICASSRVGNGI